MTKRLTAARLSELGAAAAVGIHVDGVMHAAPSEVASTRSRNQRRKLAEYESDRAEMRKTMVAMRRPR